MRYITLFIFFFLTSMAMSLSLEVSKKTWSDGAWPFTVAKGTLRCDGNSVWFESAGKKYALNGSAVARYKGQKGWIAVEKIWKPNPEIRGAKISIGPMITKGLSLCK